jgi:hypothetical protein
MLGLAKMADAEEDDDDSQSAAWDDDVDVGAVAERTDPMQKTNNDTSYKVFME